MDPRLRGDDDGGLNAMASTLYLGRQEWLKPLREGYKTTFNEVATRALITHEDKVLLVYEGHLDSWWLPGGRIKPGENMLSGLAREIEEETALQTQLGDLVGFFDVVLSDSGKNANKHIFHFIFAATPDQAPDFIERDHFDTDPDHPGKVSKMRWFTLDELQATPNVYPACIRNWPALLAARPKAYYGTKLEDGKTAIENIERFYISTRVVTTHDDRILMVYNRKGDFWYGPGGQIEFGEDLHACATREVMEETGLPAQAGDVIAVDEFYSPTYGLHQINLYTRCHLAHDQLPDGWTDIGSDGHVDKCAFHTPEQLAALPRAYPAYMAELAWPVRQPVIPAQAGIHVKAHAG